MLADFVINGIDTIFNKKLNISGASPKTRKRQIQSGTSSTSAAFSKQLVKKNLNNVVRRRQNRLMFDGQSYFDFSKQIKDESKGCVYEGWEDHEDENDNDDMQIVENPGKRGKARSRLKLILEHNKQQKLSSVIKSGHKRDLSNSTNAQPQSQSKVSYHKIDSRNESRLKRLTPTMSAKSIFQQFDRSAGLSEVDQNVSNMSALSRQQSKKIGRGNLIDYYRDQRKSSISASRYDKSQQKNKNIVKHGNQSQFLANCNRQEEDIQSLDVSQVERNQLQRQKQRDRQHHNEQQQPFFMHKLFSNCTKGIEPQNNDKRKNPSHNSIFFNNSSTNHIRKKVLNKDITSQTFPFNKQINTNHSPQKVYHNNQIRNNHNNDDIVALKRSYSKNILEKMR